MIKIVEEVREELAQIVESAHNGGVDAAIDAIVDTLLDEQGLPRQGEFNYAIGYRVKGSRYLNCYLYASKQVFFGDRHDAASMLSYVRKQEPRKNWQIVSLGA